MEGKRSGENAEMLLVDQKRAMPLDSLEGSWMGLKTEDANYAYAWALASIENIVQNDGMEDVGRILNRIGDGSATEAALHEVLHENYEDLMRSTREYLRKKYGTS
jgi:hypothetical protein